LRLQRTRGVPQHRFNNAWSLGRKGMSRMVWHASLEITGRRDRWPADGLVPAINDGAP